MNLEHLLREVIATGKLQEPFTAAEAVRALELEEWPFPRVQSFLTRHCIGNLAATTLFVERVSFGRYRLIYDGPREQGEVYLPEPSGPNDDSQRETSGPPDEWES